MLRKKRKSILINCKTFYGNSQNVNVCVSVCVYVLSKSTKKATKTMKYNMELTEYYARFHTHSNICFHVVNTLGLILM